MNRYSKSIAAALGSVSAWGVTAAATGGISGVEWYGLLGALGTTLAVYGIPNSAPPSTTPS